MVASGRQNHVRVPTQVDGLLFSGTSGEVESAIKPDGNQWRDVGRPSARTVEIQNSSAFSSTRRVSSHGVATVSGSLKRVSSIVTGSFIKNSF